MAPKRRGWRARLLLGLLVAGCGSGGGGGGSGGAGGGGGSTPLPEPARSAFSVAGTIQTAAATAVDGDVNDPLAPRRSNDTLATAQEIPNPATLGGYVNQPGAGAPGASFAAGDVRDLYRTALAAGQQIRLFVSEDGALQDLDLRLLALDGTEIAVSDGPAAMESIGVPESGEFVIEVSAFSGASSYVLTVGREVASAAAAPLPEPEFVPGQLIVRFRSSEAGSGVPRRLAARTRAAGLRTLAGAGRDEKLLDCPSPNARDLAFRALGVEHLVPSDPAIRALPSPAQLRRDTRILAKAMRRQQDVLSADLNYVRRPSATPTDELYPLQWHYDQIHLPEAWDRVQPASGIVVAVVDTGVAAAHPDLQGQLLPGYDFIQDSSVALDGDGCDPDATDPGDGLVPGASSYHGTHVAATVAARTRFDAGAGAGSGGAGVAWNARVLPLRVLGRGGGTDFDIMQAIRFAAGLSNACGAIPQETADVINLSLGGAGSSQAFQDLIDQVRDRGIVVVAAAGNFSTDAPFYPAAYDGVLSVGAVDFARRLAPYSNFGPTVDLVAPGGDLRADRNGDGFPDGILSARVDGGASPPAFSYGFAEGTSMAAPHVAGVIALLLGVNPALGPIQIDGMLAAGLLTEDLGSPSLFGAGLIDGAAAVAAAAASLGGAVPAPPPRIRVSPTALTFGALGDQADLAVSGVGAPGPRLLSAAASTDDGAPWLDVVTGSVDGAGLGSYRVLVDRSGAPGPGVYSGRIRFTSTANTVEIPVLMQVGGLGGGLNAGHHFVVLLDPVSLESLYGVSADLASGRYTFQIEDVSPGEYLLVAGSDLDNDFVICDPGEACGAYPTADDPERILVDGSRSGLGFVTGFRASLPAAAGARGTQRGLRGGIARPRLRTRPAGAPEGGP